MRIVVITLLHLEPDPQQPLLAVSRQSGVIFEMSGQAVFSLSGMLIRDSHINSLKITEKSNLDPKLLGDTKFVIQATNLVGWLQRQ